MYYIHCTLWNTDTTLVLSNVRRTQRGFYQCFATNQVGTAHASISLNVLPGTRLVSGMFAYWLLGYILADDLLSGCRPPK